SQVNARSVLATSFEVGAPFVGNLPVTVFEDGTAASFNTQGIPRPQTLSERNLSILRGGLLQALTPQVGIVRTPILTNGQPVLINGRPIFSQTTVGSPPGFVSVLAGAQISTTGPGYILLSAPTVTNSGTLRADAGQVSLIGAIFRRPDPDNPDAVLRPSFIRSTGSGDEEFGDPLVRGLLLTYDPLNLYDGLVNSVRNTEGALIEAAGGYISLQSDAVLQDGVLLSSTGVSRNGSVLIEGANVRLGAASAIIIGPDTGTETIPQAPESIASFKSSRIVINASEAIAFAEPGSEGQREAGTLEFGPDSLIYAPGATVNIRGSSILVDDNVLFDVGGLKDLLLPDTRNTLTLETLKRNELRDSPAYRNSFLNGATIVVDPRRTGVRADGVAWIGSPLVEAGSFVDQIGVTASELLTRGGSIDILAIDPFTPIAQGAPGAPIVSRPSVLVVRPTAQFDISGGWVRYAGGIVQTSRLITATGQLVDIGNADVNETYVGLVSPIEQREARWGITDVFRNPNQIASRPVEEFVEGRDAGSLSVSVSALDFQGTVAGEAFSGVVQRNLAQPGSRTSAIAGDRRRLQANVQQLPSAGRLAFTVRSTVQLDQTVPLRSSVEFTTLAPLDFAFQTSLGIDAGGNVVDPELGDSGAFPDERRRLTAIDPTMLAEAGLAQFSLTTTGNVKLGADVSLELQPGGSFEVRNTGRIDIEGSVSVPGGRILLDGAQNVGGLQQFGSLAPPPGAGGSPGLPLFQPGAFDVTVTGTLSAAGRWVN
ncbi:MAG: hypothetical protein ACRC1J_02815, partial [Sandaracinobacteroides sp.]